MKIITNKQVVVDPRGYSNADGDKAGRNAIIATGITALAGLGAALASRPRKDKSAPQVQQVTAPPPPADNKKKDNNLLIYGAVGVALLIGVIVITRNHG
jgi:hypothetical protein